MVKPTLGVLLVALVLGLVPASARANKLKLTSYQLGPSAGVIELEADAPLDEPWMKISGTTLRVWFPKIDKLSRFEQGDSEQPIRGVRLRAGAGETALLSVELSAEHALSPDDVALSRSGTRASVRIALQGQQLAERPAAPDNGSAMSAASATPAALATPGATAPGHAPSGVSAPSALAQPGQDGPQFKAGGATAAVAPQAATNPARTAEPKLLESKQGPSTLQLLMLLSLALGAVYGALRIGLRRRAAGALQPSIVVLGSKRLGPRHQLLIVRALGQDHLLSVHGGRTETIMSTDSPGAGAAAAPAATRDPNDGVDPVGAGMAATLRSLRSRELFKQGAAPTQRRAADDDAQGHTFGAELLDFVRGQTRAEAAPPEPATQKPRLTESEAIAGLVRLRKRSG